MELYERIRHLRKNILNLSQEEFGKALGVNRDVINNIERGRLKRPDQKEPLYKLICSTYKINYAWLTEGIGEIREQTDSSSMTRIDAIMTGENEFAKNLFKAFAKLDKSEWEALEKIIQKLSQEL